MSNSTTNYNNEDLITESWEILGGPGISVENVDGSYTISSDSSGVLTDGIDGLDDATTIQDALTVLAERVATADGIRSGAVIKATEDGTDPEYPEYGDLLENGLYIRLESESGKIVHISAFEIDKAVGIIAEMVAGKADIGDVDTVREELAGKASSTELELIKGDINLKADKDRVDTLAESIKTKADSSVINDIITSIEGKANTSSVTALSTAVQNKAEKVDFDLLYDDVQTKATKTSVENIKNDIKVLQDSLGSLSNSSTIKYIQQQIDTLKNQVQNCLTNGDTNQLVSDVESLSQSVSELNTHLESVESSVQSKASTKYVQGQVNELNKAITSLASRFGSKADKSALANKASQADLDHTVKRLSELTLKTEKDFEELNDCCDEIKSTLLNKASKTYVDSRLSDIETDLGSKASQLSVNETVGRLNNKITDLQTNTESAVTALGTELYDIDCHMTNELIELKSLVDIIENNVTENTNQITELVENDIKYEQEKMEWVRVMTPEAYNSMPPVGSQFSDGTYDPYAKQPNIIYMLVRYNKPVAVYIGDVLIAEANKDTGSVGFAYNFPIIF
jgi:hypothetical protein